MKACHQKHMLYALLAAVAIVVAPSWLWVAFGPQATPTVRLQVRNIDVDKDAFTPSDTEPTKRHVGGLPDDLPPFHGQIGLGVNVLPDHPAPILTAIQPPPVHAPEVAVVAIDSEISVSDLTDGETGPYVPADADYVFDIPPPDTPLEPAIVPCSVLVAVPPEYPRIARDGGKEGAAGVIVCIDETGRVSLFSEDIIRDFEKHHLQVEEKTYKVDGHKCQFNYVVTYEEPSGWFFARKVVESLPKWVFRPSLVDGRPVPSLLPIGHAFCLTADCNHEYEAIRNYKHYSQVDQ